MWPKHETPANVFLCIAMVVKVDTVWVWNEEMMQWTLEEVTPFLLAGYFVISKKVKPETFQTTDNVSTAMLVVAF